jgi:nucleoside-diphosphate-sugar epimerase
VRAAVAACQLTVTDCSYMPALLSGSVAAVWSQGPEGVRGRNSENSLILSQLGWEPTVKLQDGLRLTYQWIKQQVCSCFPPRLLHLPAVLST